ncbi:MAG TPA: polysaccharide biosynthesis C-terminal domain-containing protein [Flavobacteriales bacterium]|nr:polysaccharide biosynthesis C-terminal domain-containing protein [Flavobacteriales bacterium]
MGKLAKEGVNSTIFILMGFAIGTIANLFIYPKVCSKDELGLFKVLLNWAFVITPFITFGASSIALKYYLHFKDKNRLGELNFILSMYTLIGIAVFLVVFIPFSVFFIDDIALAIMAGAKMATGHVTTGVLMKAEYVMFVVIMFTILQAFLRVTLGLAVATKKASNNFFINEFLIRIMLLGCFILYYYKYVTYEGLMALIMASFALQLLMVIYTLWSFYTSGFVRPDKADNKKILQFGLYSMLDTGANLIVTRLDMIMISLLALNATGSAQEYDLAINIATMVYLPWRSLSAAAAPFVSEAFHRNDMTKVDNLYKKTSLSLFLVGAAIFTFIFPNIDDIIKMIPGDYSAIKYPVLFLSIAKLIDMLGSVNGTILIMSPYYKLNLIFNLFLIVITLIANWILIPIIGITGSAIATIIAIVLFNLAKGIFLTSKYGFSPFHNKTAVCLFFMAIIFTIGMFIPSFYHIPIVDILIRSTIIGVFIYAFFVFMKPLQDFENMRLKILRRFRLIS